MGLWAFSCVQIRQVVAHGISHAVLVLVCETNLKLDRRARNIDIFVLKKQLKKQSQELQLLLFA